MEDYLKKMPPELKEIIRRCARLSLEIGMPAYLVGGCLRDLILGVKNCDLDITIEGNGILFAKKLAEESKAQLLVHERFGTATLTLPGCLKLDIATTRQEKYSHPGALPVVSYGLLEDDLQRRDFTINAMALGLSAGKQGIIDPFGGRKDLASGKIRILHDLSFIDDPTRILRAVRFSQRFAFKIEPHSMRLLKQALAAGMLGTVNPHRLRDELVLALKEREPFKPLKQLADLGALSFISPKLKVGAATRSLFKSVARGITWFGKNFPARRKLDCWLIYLMACLEPLALPRIKTVTRKLGLRKGEEKRMLSFFRGRRKIAAALSKTGVGPQRIFALLEPLSYETVVLLSAEAKNKNYKNNLVDFFRVYNGMRLCVGGKELRELGVLPGPQYQKIFAAVLAAKLKGEVSGRQQELAMICRLVDAHKRNGEG